jgi:hypothetical protein
VSEGDKLNEKNMDSVLCGEDITFQVINFAPSSSYFIGNYKLPVISENEEKGEVICKSPATPPGAESSYKLAVFIEEDINSPTDAHCGALSFGPLNIAYHYGNVNINKLFSLLGDGIGFYGQGILIASDNQVFQK